MEADEDIYSNLPNNESQLLEDVEKLQQQNNLLQELIKSLESDIEKLCAKITDMKKIQDNLTKNISELYKTAKTEIERKDRTIAELRGQLEDYLFHRRRVNVPAKRDRERSPALNRAPNDSVAKKMRYDDENRLKRGYQGRSKSRSRSIERAKRPYRDRSSDRNRRDNRFDRYRYDHDARRNSLRDDQNGERNHKVNVYPKKEYDNNEKNEKEAMQTTELKDVAKENTKITLKNTREETITKASASTDSSDVQKKHDEGTKNYEENDVMKDKDKKTEKERKPEEEKNEEERASLIQNTVSSEDTETDKPNREQNNEEKTHAVKKGKKNEKVNRTKIEEVTKKLFERLEEDSKQDPEKATYPISLKISNISEFMDQKEDINNDFSKQSKEIVNSVFDPKENESKETVDKCTLKEFATTTQKEISTEVTIKEKCKINSESCVEINNDEKKSETKPNENPTDKNLPAVQQVTQKNQNEHDETNNNSDDKNEENSQTVNSVSTVDGKLNKHPQDDNEKAEDGIKETASKTTSSKHKKKGKEKNHATTNEENRQTDNEKLDKGPSKDSRKVEDRIKETVSKNESSKQKNMGKEKNSAPANEENSQTIDNEKLDKWLPKDSKKIEDRIKDAVSKNESSKKKNMGKEKNHTTTNEENTQTDNEKLDKALSKDSKKVEDGIKETVSENESSKQKNIGKEKNHATTNEENTQTDNEKLDKAPSKDSRKVEDGIKETVSENESSKQKNMGKEKNHATTNEENTQTDNEKLDKWPSKDSKKNEGRIKHKVSKNESSKQKNMGKEKNNATTNEETRQTDHEKLDKAPSKDSRKFEDRIKNTVSKNESSKHKNMEKERNSATANNGNSQTTANEKLNKWPSKDSMEVEDGIVETAQRNETSKQYTLGKMEKKTNDVASNEDISQKINNEKLDKLQSKDGETIQDKIEVTASGNESSKQDPHAEKEKEKDGLAASKESLETSDSHKEKLNTLSSKDSKTVEERIQETTSKNDSSKQDTHSKKEKNKNVVAANEENSKTSDSTNEKSRKLPSKSSKKPENKVKENKHDEKNEKETSVSSTNEENSKTVDSRSEKADKLPSKSTKKVDSKVNEVVKNESSKDSKTTDSRKEKLDDAKNVKKIETKIKELILRQKRLITKNTKEKIISPTDKTSSKNESPKENSEKLPSKDVKKPENKSNADTKSKKNKDSSKKDTKPDEAGGSVVIEESDRVLRSATRRNSTKERQQEEVQKKTETKIVSETGDVKNRKTEKFDPLPGPSDDFITVNLSHDGEIPVLHIAEIEPNASISLFGPSKTSTLLNFENSIMTSSPFVDLSGSTVKVDSSFDVSSLNSSNSMNTSENGQKVLNTSSARKRRRVTLKMID